MDKSAYAINVTGFASSEPATVVSVKALAPYTAWGPHDPTRGRTLATKIGLALEHFRIHGKRLPVQTITVKLITLTDDEHVNLREQVLVEGGFVPFRSEEVILLIPY